MKKKIDKKRLEKLYLTAIEKKADKSLIKKNQIFESPIYFDNRQYSLKLPRRIFDFITYKKGCKLVFTIEEKDPKNPSLKVEYKGVE